MAKKGLKNVIRLRSVLNGNHIWRLTTLQGEPIPAFDYFCEKNLGYAYRTQKRYAEVVSRFIDYLFEAGIFDHSVSVGRLNAVVDAYSLLLEHGCSTTAARVRKTDCDLWLADVAGGLDWPPMSPKSLDNTFAAVNRFLRLSENLAREARERAAVLGLDLVPGYTTIIKALDEAEQVGRHEILAMKQNSMFGNVARYAHKGIKRARGLGPRSNQSSNVRCPLDFPREFFPALIEAARSWRDKSLWLMLGATGIRTSEALNLHLDDIDFKTQKIYVFDPRGRRTELGPNDPSRLRFKGREMAHTYPIPELRKSLFYALKQYLDLEYVPCYSPGEAPYLFQYIDPRRRGYPYVNASPAALAQSFRRAVRPACVPVPTDGKDWVPHSLRHMYGVYMVNDFPTNPQQGQFGLPLVEVQMMMGHSSIRSTAHYARTKQRRLEAKLAASDQAMLGMTNDELRALPVFHIRWPELGP